MSTETNTPAVAPVTPPANLWSTVGISLVVAAALLVLAGVVYAIGIDIDARFRIEFVSTIGASMATAVLALGAVLALMAAAHQVSEPGRLRPWFAIAFAVSIAVVLLSAYSVWDYATAHVDTAPFATGIVALHDEGWKSRLATMLPHVATGIVAALAMVLANRRAPVSGSRENEAPRPD